MTINEEYYNGDPEASPDPVPESDSGVVNVAYISDGNGSHCYTANNMEALFTAIYNGYVRDAWDDDLFEEEIPEDEEAAVRRYFELAEEWIINGTPHMEIFEDEWVEE